MKRQILFLLAALAVFSGCATSTTTAPASVRTTVPPTLAAEPAATTPATVLPTLAATAVLTATNIPIAAATAAATSTLAPTTALTPTLSATMAITPTAALTPTVSASPTLSATVAVAVAITGDPKHGKQLFHSYMCDSCHDDTHDSPGGFYAPNLRNIATEGERVIHLPEYTGTAKNVPDYIRESVLTPNVYIVPGDGYTDKDTGLSAMYQEFADKMKPPDLDDIIAYLLSLDKR